MSEKTWPHRSETLHFATLQFPTETPTRNAEAFAFAPTRARRFSASPPPSPSRRSALYHRDFSELPTDVLTRIAANFNLPHLQAASLVCRSWRDGLRPLREAMVFLRWGKRFKHGRGGVKPNLEKALDCFLKGAARGSTLAMVDGGLLYWQMGKIEEGVRLYRRAAELGDPAGQCNLGISYLQAQPPNLTEAIKWLYKASFAGYVRAQYQLAICLHRGGGPIQNLKEAAKWYQKAAEGGYVRGMYNTSLCYSLGMGFLHSHRQARKWMERAADCGHSKAQFEHGLTLFAEGQMLNAAVYLELATRGGETAAAHVRDVIFQTLPEPGRARALHLATNWRVPPAARNA